MTAIDDYIQKFSPPISERLSRIRKIMHEEIPGAEEVLSYGVPTFKLQGKYVAYFAGFNNHLSIYPVFSSMEEALPEIVQYRTGKGTLQFSHKKPLPLPLIRKIVRLLLAEHQKRRY
jgi:uncharacterized protein YdhG (YjbR/CyaY superfamily)